MGYIGRSGRSDTPGPGRYSNHEVLPNMKVVVPCDANEVKKATLAAAEIDGPSL